MLEQDNGTNARGIFSKRESPNSDNSYGVFFRGSQGEQNFLNEMIDENGDGIKDKAWLYVDIDGTNNRFHSDSYIYKDRWTHVAIVFDGNLPQDQRAKIYINGNLDKTSSESSESIPDLNSNFYIGNLFYGDSQLKVFKGKIDEIKITKEALSAERIKSIYDNEVQGVDYLGRARDCTCTLGSTSFDIWRNCPDDPSDAEVALYTILKDMNQTIYIPFLDVAEAEYKDFQGDLNISINYPQEGEKVLLEEIVDLNITKDQKCYQYDFSSTRASREAFFEVNRIDAINGEESNKSSDNFAIRPASFDISLPDSYAGEDFNLSVLAVDNSDENLTGYDGRADVNISLSNSSLMCTNEDGDLTKSDGSIFSSIDFFYDSTKSSATKELRFKDIGNFAIYLNDSTWTQVDANKNECIEDSNIITPDADGKIGCNIENSAIVQIDPYDLNITQADYIASTGSDWLYVANKSDWADMNASLHVKLQAFNKDGNPTENFDGACYAEDVNVTIDFNTTREDGTYSFATSGFSGEESTNISLTNTNLKRTLTFPASEFNASTAEGSFVFNIDRSLAEPKGPVRISLNEIKVASSDVAKKENNVSNLGKKDFLYGRLRAYDVETSMKPEVEVPLFIEVYGSFGGAGQQNTLNWYTNKRHDNNSSFGGIVGLNSTSLEGGLSATNSDVTQVSSNTADGIVNLKLDHVFEDEAQKRTIHLGISPWLWHLPGNNANAYDYNLSSTCKEHPCFEFYYYPYGTSVTGNAIRSGDGEFGGSDFNLSDTERTQQGVKVFR